MAFEAFRFIGQPRLLKIEFAGQAALSSGYLHPVGIGPADYV